MKFIKRLTVVFCLLFLMMFTVQSVVPEQVSVITAAEAAAKVKMNKKKATINAGDKLQLQVTGTSKKAKWSSSNPSVATVNKKGVVKGKQGGKATITATVDGKNYTCKVTVKSSITVNKTELSLGENESASVTITCVKKGKLSLKVDNTNVVDCDFEEKWHGNTIKLLIETHEAGNAKITIKDSRTKATAEIRVTVGANSWTKEHIDGMQQRIRVAEDSMENTLDYANMLLDYEDENNLAAGIRSFRETAVAIKSCIDYAAGLDPIMATDGTTLIDFLESAYKAYTSFDSSAATGDTFIAAAQAMYEKLYAASVLFTEYVKLIQN